MTNPDPARVLIVDDHPVVREGLAAQIALQPDLVVCGEAEDLADALDKAETTMPDVAVIDISLKSSNGLELIRRLRTRDHPVRIVVWSMHPESLYAERALRAGALGYVHKSKATREILQAIRAALAGAPHLSTEVAQNLLSRLAGVQSEQSPIATLSNRELEVFRYMGEGLTTEQIARKMCLSPKTVETYRARMKEKLGLSNITELIQRAAQWVLENG